MKRLMAMIFIIAVGLVGNHHARFGVHKQHRAAQRNAPQLAAILLADGAGLVEVLLRKREMDRGSLTHCRSAKEE